MAAGPTTLPLQVPALLHKGLILSPHNQRPAASRFSLGSAKASTQLPHPTYADFELLHWGMIRFRAGATKGRGEDLIANLKGPTVKVMEGIVASCELLSDAGLNSRLQYLPNHWIVTAKSLPKSDKRVSRPTGRTRLNHSPSCSQGQCTQHRTVPGTQSPRREVQIHGR